MSAATAKMQDPSMEEILASIRRIIADDYDTPKHEAGANDASVQDTPVARVVPDPAAPGSETAPGQDEDVLDLAEMRQTDPGEVAADFDEDPPELCFAEPEIERPAAREVRVEPPPERVRAASPGTPLTYAPEPPRGPQPAAPARTSAGSLEASLVSTATTASVGQAFNILSHTIMAQNARTLEDVVQELLKPMLRTWLDDNLPTMVERLVRAEIERVARGGPR